MSRGVPVSLFPAHLTQQTRLPFFLQKPMSSTGVYSSTRRFASIGKEKRKRKSPPSRSMKIDVTSVDDFINLTEMDGEPATEPLEESDHESMFDDQGTPLYDMQEQQQPLPQNEDVEVELEEDQAEVEIFKYADPSLRLIDTNEFLMDTTHQKVQILDGKVHLQPAQKVEAQKRTSTSRLATLRRRLRVLVDSFIGTMNHMKEPSEQQGVDQLVYKNCSFLLVLGLSCEEIQNQCVICPHVLLLSLEDTLLPKVNSLRDAGQSTEHIQLLLRIRPKSFLMPSESFLALVNALVDQGIAPKDLFRVVRTSGFLSMQGTHFNTLVKSFSASLNVQTDVLLRIIIGKPSFLLAAGNPQIGFQNHFHTSIRNEMPFYLFSCLKQSPWIASLQQDKTLEEQHYLYKQYWPHLDFYRDFFFKYPSVIIHSQYQIETRIKALMYTGMPQYMALECIERCPRILQYQLDVLISKLLFFTKELGLRGPNWEQFVARYDSENVYRYHFLDKHAIIKHTHEFIENGQTIQTHGYKDSSTIDFNGQSLERGQKQENGKHQISSLRLRIGLKDKRILALHQKMNDLSTHYTDMKLHGVKKGVVHRQSISATCIAGERMVITGTSPVYQELMKDKNELPLALLADLPEIAISSKQSIIEYVLTACAPEMEELGLTRDDIYIQLPTAKNACKGKILNLTKADAPCAPAAVGSSIARKVSMKNLSYNQKGELLFSPAQYCLSMPSGGVIDKKGNQCVTPAVKDARRCVESYFPQLSSPTYTVKQNAQSLRKAMKALRNIPLAHLTTVVRTATADKTSHPTRYSLSNRPQPGDDMSGIDQRLFSASQLATRTRKLFPAHVSALMGGCIAAMMSNKHALAEIESKEVNFYIKPRIIDIQDGLDYYQDPMVECMDEELMRLIEVPITPDNKAPNELDILAQKRFVESDTIQSALYWEKHSKRQDSIDTADPESTVSNMKHVEMMHLALKSHVQSKALGADNSWSRTEMLRVASLATLLHVAPTCIGKNIIHTKRNILALHAFFTLLGRQDERLYAHGLLGENTYLSATVDKSGNFEVQDHTDECKVSHQNKTVLNNLQRIIYDTYNEANSTDTGLDLDKVRESIQSPRNSQLLNFEAECVLSRKIGTMDSPINVHMVNQSDGHPIHGPLLSSDYTVSSTKRKKFLASTTANKLDRSVAQFSKFFAPNSIGKDSVLVPKYSLMKPLFDSNLSDHIVVRFQIEMDDNILERIEYLRKTHGYHELRIIKSEGSLVELAGVIPACLQVESIVTANEVITPFTVRKKEWVPLQLIGSQVRETDDVVEPVKESILLKSAKKHSLAGEEDQDDSMLLEEELDDELEEELDDERQLRRIQAEIQSELEQIQNTDSQRKPTGVLTDAYLREWQNKKKVRIGYDELMDETALTSLQRTQMFLNSPIDEFGDKEVMGLPSHAAYNGMLVENSMPLYGNLSNFTSFLTEHVNAPQSQQITLSVIHYILANPTILTRRTEYTYRALALALAESIDNTNKVIEAAHALRISRAAYATHKLGLGMLSYAEKTAEENRSRVIEAKKAAVVTQEITTTPTSKNHTSVELGSALGLMFGRANDRGIARSLDTHERESDITDKALLTSQKVVQNTDLPDTVPLLRAFINTEPDETSSAGVSGQTQQNQFHTFLHKAPYGVSTHVTAQYYGTQAHRTVSQQQLKTQLLVLNNAEVHVPLTYEDESKTLDVEYTVPRASSRVDLQSDVSNLSFPLKTYRYFAMKTPSAIPRELHQLGRKLSKLSVSSVFQTAMGSQGYVRSEEEDKKPENATKLQTLWNRLERVMIESNNWIRELSTRVMAKKPTMQPRVTDEVILTDQSNDADITGECEYTPTITSIFDSDFGDTQVCSTEQLVELPPYVDEVSIEIQNGEVLIFGSTTDNDVLNIQKQAHRVLLKPDTKQEDPQLSGARVKLLQSYTFVSSVNSDRRGFSVQDTGMEKRQLPELANFPPLRVSPDRWTRLSDLVTAGMQLTLQDIGEGFLVPQSPVSVVHSLVSPPASDGSTTNYFRITHYKDMLHTNIFLSKLRSSLRKAWYSHPNYSIAHKSLRMLASAETTPRVLIQDTLVLYEPVALRSSVMFSNSTNSFVIDACLNNLGIQQALTTTLQKKQTVFAPQKIDSTSDARPIPAKTSLTPPTVSRPAGEELDISKVLEEVGKEEEEGKEFEIFHTKWFVLNKLLKQEISNNTMNSHDKRTTIIAECYAPLLQKFFDHTILNICHPKMFYSLITSVLSAPSSKTVNMYTPPRVLASSAVQQLGIVRYLNMMQYVREALLLTPEPGKYMLSDYSTQFHRTDEIGRGISQVVQEEVSKNEEHRLKLVRTKLTKTSGPALVRGAIPVMDGVEASDSAETIHLAESLLRSPCVVNLAAFSGSKLCREQPSINPQHIDVVSTNKDHATAVLDALPHTPLPLSQSPLDFALTPYEVEVLLSQHNISSKGHFQGAVSSIKSTRSLNTATTVKLRADLINVLSLMTTKAILAPTPDIAPDHNKEEVHGVLVQSPMHAALKLYNINNEIKSLHKTVSSEADQNNISIY